MLVFQEGSVTFLPPIEDEFVHALLEIGGHASPIACVACARRAIVQGHRRTAHVLELVARTVVSPLPIFPLHIAIPL